MSDISSKKLFLIDMDGVFLRGKENPLKLGGTRIIGRLREKRKKLFVLTNDSTDSRATIRRRLASLDIDVDEEEILTATRVTAEYLLANFGRVRYYLVGEAGMQEELDRLGHVRTRRPDANVVVVGMDRKFTYRKLDTAVRAARSGASIVAAHTSMLFLDRGGPSVGVGPILKAIEYGSGKRGLTVGKPSSQMFRIALSKSRCRPSEALMVGDQEDTDIEGAARLGIDSVLVLSGMEKEGVGSKAMMRVENVDDLAALI